ncbi:MAG: hypothetical protein ACK2T3_17455, partial [Candidatus Promineifilaceae bacterium]
EIDWMAEGGAMLAEDLLGYPGVGLQRANIFLADPDQQLNRWTEGDAKSYYGQGYLLNRYIFDRLGPEFYHQLSTAPETGLAAVDAIAAQNGVDTSGIDIWLDWLAAQAIQDIENVPEQYRLNLEGLVSPLMTPLNAFSVELDETVNQFAADYYRFEGDDGYTVRFEGAGSVPVIGESAASGSKMWISDRANFRHMRLTRSLDLRDLETATLEYDVYHEIESGYDFAYVFASQDGGETWDSLTASGMQGPDPDDDPSNSALSDRFYTGKSDGWVRERIDLSAYAGQEIMIRFAYITDLIYTEGGIAFDNIAVPEIGFYDDAETVKEGWEAEGFELTTSTIPQNWYLQLITYSDGLPKVRRLPMPSGNEVEFFISPSEVEDGAILIVSASAPKTLHPARYKLDISG